MPDPRLATLRPDGQGRVYTHPLTRQQVPSATTILRVLGKPENLLNWAAKKAAEEAWRRRAELGSADEGMRDGWLAQLSGSSARYRDKAADDGTAVHRALELLAILSTDHLPKTRNDERELAELLMRPGVRPRAEAFLEWRRRYVRKFLLVEETAWSDAEGGHAGTFDAVVELLDGRIVGCDWKTGAGLYREMTFQQTSYMFSPWIIRGDGQTFPMIQCSMFALVHLPASGGFTFVDAEATPGALTAFYAILRLYRYSEGRQDRLTRTVPTGSLEPVQHPVDALYARVLAELETPAPWEGSGPTLPTVPTSWLPGPPGPVSPVSALFQPAPFVPELVDTEALRADVERRAAEQVARVSGVPEAMLGLPTVPEAGPKFQGVDPPRPPGPNDDLPSDRKGLAELARSIGASPAKTNDETIKRIRARQAELAAGNQPGNSRETAPRGDDSTGAGFPDHVPGVPEPPAEPDLVKQTLAREIDNATGPGQHVHGVDGWSQTASGSWVCATPYPGGARCGYSAPVAGARLPAPEQPAPADQEDTRKQCGVCHERGHNARTCTKRQRPDVEDPDGRMGGDS